MLKRIKGTITNFIIANRRLSFSCGILIAFFVSFYLFTAAPRAQLANCTSAATLNTSYPATTCNPVACQSLSDNDVKNVDNAAGYNCYYAPLGTPLRPCKAFKNASAQTSPDPRNNCADIIDLPLCSVTSGARPGINCVPESKDVGSPVNNVNSVRFCGRPEAGCTGSCATQCTQIKCHQMTATETPNSAGGNCSILDCKFLALDELKVSDHRFEDGSKQYCAGLSKCYTFFNNTVQNPNNSDNLKYIRYRIGNTTMCQIHNCPPTTASCGANDVNNIQNDTQYRNDYVKYINGNSDINGGLCTYMECKPVALRSYRCLPMADANPTTLNSVCDTPQTCSGGYCTKRIDCNLPANNDQPECMASTHTAPSSTVDVFNAWFYRPIPPDFVTNQTTGLIDTAIASKIRANLCYNVGDASWGDQNTSANPNDLMALGWGRTDTYDDGALIKWFLYWHVGQPTRSPGMCGVGNAGAGRGVGYGSLCGTNFNIFANPSDNVGFIKGFAQAIYSDTVAPQYKITGCLRYTNSANLASCGSRECRFDVTDGSASAPTKIQYCGSDECRDMTISDDDADRCSMSAHGDIFDGSASPKPSCVTDSIDTYVRMRARKYGRRICVYIDENGAVAYDDKNFKGQETLGDGVTCVDGTTLDADGHCQGKNTNANPEAATLWRTVKRIQYIGNNRPSGNRGYIDMNGRFFAEQDCAKIPLRIGPPRFYQVANVVNSKGLFEPPVYIVDSRVTRNGEISNSTGEILGKTDFLTPEIEVGFGTIRQKLSLGAGFVGNDNPAEQCGASDYCTTSPASVTIQSVTGNNNVTYEADLFVKKEYNRQLSMPNFCLYRNVNDANGLPAPPIKIGCAMRNKPEISDIFNNKTRMKVSIVPDSANVFNSAKLKFHLVYSPGANNLNDNCTGDDSCSKEIVFENTNVDSEVCNTDVDAYEFCSARDHCSQLVYECANNEIDRHNAIINNLSTGPFDIIRANCNGSLLTECNAKFGIVSNDAPDFFSQIDNSAAANAAIDPNYQNFQSLFLSGTKAHIDPAFSDGNGGTTAYGWFSEVCISRGFGDKIKTVIAYKTINGTPGKCLIDTVKSQYPIAKCIAGGKAPYCVCQEANIGDSVDTGLEVRPATPRESGLCMDIPIPKFCQAIDYTPVDGPVGDVNYKASSVTNSVNGNLYSGAGYSSVSTSGVHDSHQTRTSRGDANHAEYQSILGGTSTVYGTCNAFWKNQVDNGTTLQPILNCKIDGTWEKPANSNPCVYDACPTIATNGVNQGASDTADLNSYQADYALNETSDERGHKNGYAIWAAKTKTNDFLEDSIATACITGYKPVRDAGGNDILPVRYCKQDATWEQGTSTPPHNLRNQCQRIMCPIAKSVAHGGSLPNDSNTPANMNTWLFYGGAEFVNGGKASRSSTFVPPESTVTGVCNNVAGFYKGTNQPTLDCDSTGQWGNLKNACQRAGCYKISDTDADPNNNPAGGNDGFANWDELILSSNVNESTTAPTCAAGYYVNPYKSMPTRQCQITVVYDSGNNELSHNSSWGSITNPCINQCPGSDTDSVNGITPVSTSGGTVNISWSATDFGKYAYYNSNPAVCNSAAQFADRSSSNCYQVRRFCGNGSNGTTRGQWSPVEPMCIANNGPVGNATGFNDGIGSTTGTADAVAVNGLVSSTGCATGYSNGNSGSPTIRQCVYSSGNKVDEVYFALAGTSQDCVPQCQLGNGTTAFSHAQYTSSGTTYVTQGQQISLTCASHYGQAQTCTTDTGGTQTCTTAPSPSVTCNSGPSSWSGVTNDCVYVPANCGPGNTINGNTVEGARVQCCNAVSGCGAGDSSSFNNHDFRSQINAASLNNGATGTVSYQMNYNDTSSPSYCGWTAGYPNTTIHADYSCSDGVKTVTRLY